MLTIGFGAQCTLIYFNVIKYLPFKKETQPQKIKSLMLAKE